MLCVQWICIKLKNTKLGKFTTFIVKQKQTLGTDITPASTTEIWPRYRVVRCTQQECAGTLGAREDRLPHILSISPTCLSLTQIPA